MRQYKRRLKWRATGTRTCVSTVNDSTTHRRIAEPGFKTTNPVQMPEVENIGQGNTLMRKQLTELFHQSRHSLCHTTDGKQIGGDSHNTKPVLGFTDNLQQDLQDFRTRRKSQTQSQRQNRKPDYVMVIRHPGSHHLHEQLIIQRHIWEPKTEENCQRSKLHRRIWRCHELHRDL